METILLLEKLKNEGVINSSEYLESKNNISNPQTHSKDYSVFLSSFKDVTQDMNRESKDLFIEALKDYGNTKEECTTESYVKNMVSKMYHIDQTNRKQCGEKFSLEKAKEVCNRYREIVPRGISHTDMYIAINMQYHQYYCLFKTWFGDNLEHQIIESAIIFWFKDPCYTKGSKLWNYFKEY